MLFAIVVKMETTSFILHIAILTLSLLFLPTISNAVTSPEVESIKQLYNISLFNYHNKIRPVLNQSHAVDVTIQFSPAALIGLDTAEQRFEVVVHLVIDWTDEFLPWDPDAYYGTDMMILSPNQIWHPNIVYYKTVNSNSRIGDDEKDSLIVMANGMVYWHPLQYLSTVCEVSVRNYPFDEQRCMIYLNDADLANDKVTFNVSSSFSVPEHSEWELLAMHSEKDVHFSADIIKITFKLRRRYSLTLYTLIAPLIKMAVINVCIFLLPVTSGEKSSVAITLFLSYGVFMVATRDKMPANSLDVSLLVKYVFVLLVLSAFTVIYSLVESRVHCSYGDRMIHLPRISASTITTSEDKVGQSDSENRRKGLFEGKENDAGLNSVTVEVFLRWLDITMFVLIFIVTFIYSLVVFIEITSHTN